MLRQANCKIMLGHIYYPRIIRVTRAMRVVKSRRTRTGGAFGRKVEIPVLSLQRTERQGRSSRWDVGLKTRSGGARERFLPRTMLLPGKNCSRTAEPWNALGLKPGCFWGALRGAEAALFHGATRVGLSWHLASILIIQSQSAMERGVLLLSPGVRTLWTVATTR